MKVSLILDCKEESLAQVMQGIQAQEYEPYEVLFLCDVENFLARINSPKKYGVKLLDYEILTEGKMRAAAYSTGDIVCFLESNVILDTIFISHWVSMFKTNIDIYAIGPGVQMFNKSDYLDATNYKGYPDEVIYDRMHKMKNIRVENSNYVSTIEIQNLVSGNL